jgi:hypothetical protein
MSDERKMKGDHDAPFPPPPPFGYNAGMSEERKKPRVAFWATVGAVLVAVLAMYSLSFGPACWLCNHHLLPESVMPAADEFYKPMVWLVLDAPDPLRMPARWYVDFWE